MEKKQELNIVYRNIKELKPYKKNAKKHPKEQVERIANSIKEFGFTQPVIVDKNNCVVAGHGRILGAKKAGLKQVPTVMLEELTEEQIKAYRLVDNKLNESDWDFSLLDEELGILSDDIDMELFGFDTDMSDEELERAIKEVKFKTKEKHLVIVPCKNEKETIKVQKEIEQLGYKCDIKNT
jgi:hypothetical protein